MEKSTSIDLVKILHERNQNRRYDNLISLAAKNHYHCFKSEIAMPKTELINDLSVFPELSDISKMVKYGEFDESPDRNDKDELIQWINEDPNRHILKQIIGI